MMKKFWIRCTKRTQIIYG